MAAKKERWKAEQHIKGRIKVQKAGPYVVSGGVPLADCTVVTDSQGYPRSWRKDKDYPMRETYALCRCGCSKNLPFCDGSHAAAGFDGLETADHEAYLDQAEETVGPALDLTDAHQFCMSAGFCDRAGGTWSLTEQSDDSEARRIAVEEAGNCPSGRLVAWDKEGCPLEPDFPVSIGMVKDPEVGMQGPIWVRGGIPIESADGYVYEERNRVTLCGCGRSDNKPFCTGGHCDRQGHEEDEDDDPTQVL
jgi:CDGSH-type Zn-finger protein